MTPKKFKSLLAGYDAGTLTDKEKLELSALLHDPQYRDQLELLFTEDFADPDFKSLADPESLELMYQHIQLQKQPAPVRRMFPYKFRWVAAAAAILLLATGTYFFFSQSSKPTIAYTEDTLKNDVAAPAYTKAVLLLADGKEIILDSAINGQLAVQDNTNIIKPGDGQLIYTVDQSLKADDSRHMNTLTVPRGSRPLQLTLTDGTKIWLNTAASITYPVVFSGNERKVQITGEAYFEVAKDATKKFYVLTNGIETEVLGTHFNINAYEDENDIKVTLLEGSVEVTQAQGKKSKVKIKPGEQAVAIHRHPEQSEGAPFTIHHPDLDEVMAWKEGIFDFNGTDIKAVMRQLARWYNVEVEYKGKITENHFSGIINRSNNISQVLKMLQSTGGSNFKVETGSSSGRAGKIIVLSE